MRPERLRGLQTWIKRVGYGLVVLAVAWFLLRYDIERIPDGYHHLTPQHMPAGGRVVSIAIDESTHLGVGSVVVYRVAEAGDGLCYGVVAGLPGETIRFAEGGEGPEFWVGGRREDLELPTGHRIPEGPIPEGRYLVLNGDRLFVGTTGFPDSRQLGLIPRDAMLRKIIASLSFFRG